MSQIIKRGTIEKEIVDAVAEGLAAAGLPVFASVCNVSGAAISLTPVLRERDQHNGLQLRWNPKLGWHLVRAVAGVYGPPVKLHLITQALPATVAQEVAAHVGRVPGPSDDEIIAHVAQWAKVTAEIERTAPPERRCSECGARSGIVLRASTALSGAREWRCGGGCPPPPLDTPATWQIVFHRVGSAHVVPTLWVRTTATGDELADELSAAVHRHIRHRLEPAHYAVHVDPEAGWGWIDGGLLGHFGVQLVAGGAR